MTKIIQFVKEQEETEVCCPFCELVHEFKEYCMDAESEEELEEVLRDLVDEVSVLALKQYLEAELNHKTELLDQLVLGCCEEECHCEDCECDDEDFDF